MIVLEDFQKQAIASALGDLRAHRRALIVGPTGSGKTEILAATMRIELNRRAARALVLQHTTTLQAQNYKRLADRLSAMSLAIRRIGGGRTESVNGADVIVATVQSIRREWFDHLPSFDVLVIDEAHHAASDEYRGVLGDMLAINPDLAILGLTATPERADGRGLIDVFPRISRLISYEEVFATGRIVPPRTLVADLPDVSWMASHNWVDADDASVSRYFRAEVTQSEMVRQHLALGEGRTGVYFCADTDHAESLAQAFSKAGLRAAAVSHETGKRALKAAIEDIESGRLDVLTNPLMLTEGFDAPRVSLVGLARGFSSKPLLVQAVGRGMRAFPGKSDCLVLDFVGAVRRHGNVLPGTSLEGREAGRAAERAGVGLWREIVAAPVDAVTMAEVDALDGMLGRVNIPVVRLDCDNLEDADDFPAPNRKAAMALGSLIYVGAKCPVCGGCSRFLANSRCSTCALNRAGLAAVQAPRFIEYVQKLEGHLVGVRRLRSLYSIFAVEAGQRKLPWNEVAVAIAASPAVRKFVQVRNGTPNTMYDFGSCLVDASPKQQAETLLQSLAKMFGPSFSVPKSIVADEHRRLISAKAWRQHHWVAISRELSKLGLERRQMPVDGRLVTFFEACGLVVR